MTEVSYRVKQSETHPHIEWIELNGDGIMHECAVLKRDNLGNVLYFKTNSLDQIDKQRLAVILADRNVNSFELWDLMANRTLNNGVNALAYFHQLVKVLTPNGKTVNLNPGQVGIAAPATAGQINISPTTPTV